MTVLLIHSSGHDTTDQDPDIDVSVTGTHTFSSNWRYENNDRRLFWGAAGNNDVILKLTAASAREFEKQIAVAAQTGFMELS